MEYFDRIIISHCLEHIINPENFLFEMMSKLKKDGILSISLPTDPGILFGWEAPPSLPATYIINPEGKLLHTLIGPQTQESLEAYITN